MWYPYITKKIIIERLYMWLQFGGALECFHPTNALKLIVNCESLGLEESLQGSYFGHVFSKACQYTTINEKMCKNFKYIYF
jgi:hypothetical protein